MDTLPIFAAICFWIVALPLCLVIFFNKKVQKNVKAITACLLILPCGLTLLMGRWLFLNEPLYQESCHGNTQRVAQLIWLSADVNDRFEVNTPLSCAVSNGHTQTVRVLLEAGADPNIPGWEDQTPLSIAKGNNDAEIVKLLQAHGGK